MSYADLRSLQAGTQIGNELGSPIQQGFQQAAQRAFQQKMYEKQLQDEIAKLAVTNPEVAAGIVGTPTQTQVQGQNATPALPLTQNQQQNFNSGGAVDNGGFVSLGGQQFDPAKVKQAQLEQAAREFSMKRELTEIMANGKANQVVIDPVTGQVNIVNKKTAEVSPTKDASGNNAKVGVKIPTIKLLGEDGQPHLFQYVNGEKGKDLGLAESLKGQTEVDPVTGVVSIVDNRLQAGSQPGQAAPTTTADGTGGQKPFAVTPKDQAPGGIKARLDKLEPIKHFNEVQERAEVLPEILKQAQQSGDYTIADPAINEELQRMLSNQAIRQNMQGIFYKTQPISDKLQGLIQQFTQGGSKYTDKTRQEAIDVGTMLYGIAKKQRDAALDAERDSYPNKQVFDDRIAPAYPGYTPGGSKQGQSAGKYKIISVHQ